MTLETFQNYFTNSITIKCHQHHRIVRTHEKGDIVKWGEFWCNKCGAATSVKPQCLTDCLFRETLRLVILDNYNVDYTISIIRTSNGYLLLTLKPSRIGLAFNTTPLHHNLRCLWITICIEIYCFFKNGFNLYKAITQLYMRSDGRFNETKQWFQNYFTNSKAMKFQPTLATFENIWGTRQTRRI